MRISGNNVKDGTYALGDPRYLGNENPKEIWKHLVNNVRAVGFKGNSWCDVGCASGAALRYFDSELPLDVLVGVEPSEVLLGEAMKRGPDRARWMIDGLPNLDLLEGTTFDAVSCIGVLALMDDIEKNLSALSRLVAPGGFLFVLDLINPKPLDMIMRCRQSGTENWTMAYNTFSEETYRAVGEGLGFKVSFTPTPMPFPIAETDDPMVAWTNSVGDNPFTVVSGTGQILMFSLATFTRM
jgi:SAM-dependent methyltransferase